jgi:hypothetical protein
MPATHQDVTKEREPSRQTWRTRRRYDNQRSRAKLSTVGLALVWCLPWTRENYPGVERGARTLLGGRWVYETIWRWSRGHGRAPPAVSLALAAEIERRAREGLALAEALRAEAESWRPFDRSRIGFLAVDPSTGQNRRWRG